MGVEYPLPRTPGKPSAPTGRSLPWKLHIMEDYESEEEVMDFIPILNEMGIQAVVDCALPRWDRLHRPHDLFVWFRKLPDSERPTIAPERFADLEFVLATVFVQWGDLDAQTKIERYGPECCHIFNRRGECSSLLDLPLYRPDDMSSTESIPLTDSDTDGYDTIPSSDDTLVVDDFGVSRGEFEAGEFEAGDLEADRCWSAPGTPPHLSDIWL